MPFVVGFFLGRWVVQFLFFMFAHPLRFLIGLVRFTLVLAALIVGVCGPLIYSGAGWVWVVGPVLIGLFLLFLQRRLRDFAEAL